MRLRRLVALGFAALLVAGAGAAMARSGFHNSTLKVTQYPPVNGIEDVVKGRVTSPRGACVPGRTVKVYSYMQHRMLATTKSGKTDAGGHWTVKGTAYHKGRIKAKLTAAKIGGVGHRSTCRGDTVIKNFKPK